MNFRTEFLPLKGYGRGDPTDCFLDDGANALAELDPLYYEQIMAGRLVSLIEEEARVKTKAEQFRFELERGDKLALVGFGAEKWNRYFGDVGVEPPLPPNIGEILSAPCPIWPDKRVEETHKLVLVPKTLNGKPLTLNRLGRLIKKPRKGFESNYGYYRNSFKQKHGGVPCEKSHWILMTKDVIPESRAKNLRNQQQMVAKLKGGYQVPRALDVAVCILMEYVETGVRLFSNAPQTFTRCQEELEGRWGITIGNFALDRLNIGGLVYDAVSIGIAPLRMF